MLAKHVHPKISWVLGEKGDPFFFWINKPQGPLIQICCFQSLSVRLWSRLLLPWHLEMTWLPDLCDTDDHEITKVTLRQTNIAGWEIHHLKMYLLLKMVVFHCYVSLPEVNCSVVLSNLILQILQKCWDRFPISISHGVTQVQHPLWATSVQVFFLRRSKTRFFFFNRNIFMVDSQVQDSSRKGGSWPSWRSTKSHFFFLTYLV